MLLGGGVRRRRCRDIAVGARLGTRGGAIRRIRLGWRRSSP
jgi:hypothetical protein